MMNQQPTALELYPNYTGVVKDWDGVLGTLTVDNFEVSIVFRPDSFEESVDVSQVVTGMRVTFKILGDAGGRFISRYHSDKVTGDARGVAFNLTTLQTFLG